MKISLNTSRFTGLAGLLSIVLLAFSLVIGGCGTKNSASDTAPPATNDNTATTNTDPNASPAPEFDLEQVGGGRKKISDYKGKVVMLNFWATWCGPCKREIPDFMELQKEYGPKGLEIVGVALDEKGAVESFVQDGKLNYTVLMGTDQTARDYGNIRSIPTTFIIDKEGKIRNSYIGMRPKSAWVEEITSLL